jgi:hypothetical protein
LAVCSIQSAPPLSLGFEYAAEIEDLRVERSLVVDLLADDLNVNSIGGDPTCC